VSNPPDVTIRRLDAVDETQVEGLSDLLVESVDDGASVGFMHPLAREVAVAFWRRVADGVAAGERALLIAEDGTGIVGTVHLVLALPENQPHRADVTKMLVHPRARRRGVGAALMEAAEAMARDCGRTLLVLDTVTGSDADRLYSRLGWVRVGEIPDFALLARGGLWGTMVFYKRLGGSAFEPGGPHRSDGAPKTIPAASDPLGFAHDADGPAP
jgi:GNAT superfamily N-acetyltransferase